MCVPTTPLLSRLTTAQQNQMRKVNTRFQKNSDEFQKKSKLDGSAGLRSLANHQNTLTGVEQTKPQPVQKGHEGWPQDQAGRPHLSATP